MKQHQHLLGGGVETALTPLFATISHAGLGVFCVTAICVAPPCAAPPCVAPPSSIFLCCAPVCYTFLYCKDATCTVPQYANSHLSLAIGVVYLLQLDLHLLMMHLLMVHLLMVHLHVLHLLAIVCTLLGFNLYTVHRYTNSRLSHATIHHCKPLGGSKQDLEESKW